MEEIITQLGYVIEHLKYIETDYNRVSFDISVLKSCISQLQNINNDTNKIMSGDAFPLVFLDKDHIDFTYKLVCAAKDGII